MEKKRILFISYHTCPLASEEGKETGGMNVYVLELGRELARRGHLIDVVTRSVDPSIKKIVEVEKNFRVIHLKAGQEQSVPKKTLLDFIPEFTDSILAYMKEENRSYDIIDAHYYMSGLIGLELNGFLPKKIPLLITFHTLALMKNLVARSLAEQESQTRIDIEMRLTSQTDAIITPSESDKLYLKYLYQAHEGKIHQIPPGINGTLFTPMDKKSARTYLGVPEDKKIVLFVGRIEPLKGIDMLLYATKILSRQNSKLPLCLLIVGGDISQHIENRSPVLRELEQLRTTLQLSTQVTFVGQKPQHELPYYYNAADVVVMPSHYESFGMAAAEAMSCGTPVITTNATGISYLIDDRRSTLVTSVNNPILLASQIEKLLTDEEIYRQVSQKGRESVKDLRWSTVAHRIETIYSTLI